ncbi:MAG: rubrerythrin family protein [Thaumarchaeota archaeon]|nr:rubrerythrin family protein [Nitrososphaerota archaeon]
MQGPKDYLKLEYFAYVIFKAMAEREKDASRRKVLEQLKEKEYEHYEFWRDYTKIKEEPQISSFGVRIRIVIAAVLGLTFTLKLLERFESNVVEGYQQLVVTIEERYKAGLEAILKDELEHESFFLSQIGEGRLKYMSFVVLGLADAIVEISGVHAGFLGVTSSTLIAGVAGLVVGFAAAISMASAAYLQSKQQTGKPSVPAAISTGVAYIIAVVLLALPYFVTDNMPYAFGGSIIIAIFLVAGFTFYGAVLNDTKFSRDFFQAVALTIGVAIATYFFGLLVGQFFGIQAII